MEAYNYNYGERLKFLGRVFTEPHQTIDALKDCVEECFYFNEEEWDELVYLCEGLDFYNFFVNIYRYCLEMVNNKKEIDTLIADIICKLNIHDTKFNVITPRITSDFIEFVYFELPGHHTENLLAYFCCHNKTSSLVIENIYNEIKSKKNSYFSVGILTQMATNVNTPRIILLELIEDERPIYNSSNTTIGEIARNTFFSTFI
jgi:hypothetical protein